MRLLIRRPCIHSSSAQQHSSQQVAAFTVEGLRPSFHLCYPLLHLVLHNISSSQSNEVRTPAIYTCAEFCRDEQNVPCTVLLHSSRPQKSHSTITAISIVCRNEMERQPKVTLDSELYMPKGMAVTMKSRALYPSCCACFNVATGLL